LADDHPELLAALRRLLESSCAVVGSVSTGRQAVAAAIGLRPDVIVLDLDMPDLNGLEVCRQIREAAPETDVVLLTAADEPGLQPTAVEVGASALVPKHMAAGVLTATIQRIFGEKRRL
jgi:DNA-binding NarL/FixJ family response regulator